MENVISDIRTAVKRYNLISNGDHIVFGLSGGPDSVCLFFALYLMKEELGITMSAVHINHKFRPGAAEEDQQYVEEMCKRLAVPCRTVVKDCNIVAKELGITSEEAGRRVRYEAFDEEAAAIEQAKGLKKSQIKIAVAHNAEDQAETLLFRIMRGTGTDGLAGIERTRLSEKGYTIIRPILGVNRADIEAFCEAHELNPRIDHTNLEPIYARNKIRLGLIPYISENFNENITETLNRLAIISAADKEYLWQKAEEAYREARREQHKNIPENTGIKSDDKQAESSGEKPTEISLELASLQKMHPAIRHRVIMRAFDEIGLGKDIGAVHTEAADTLIDRGVTGKTAEFPYGYTMVIRYDTVVFKSPRKYSPRLINDGEVKAGVSSKSRENIEESKTEPAAELFTRLVSAAEWQEYKASHAGGLKDFAGFDYEALCEDKGIVPRINSDEQQAGTPITLRTKQAGDYITLPVGRKKLQDLLVDSKVPRDLRDGVLVAAVGNEILWVIGADSGIAAAPIPKGRYSAKFSVTDTTKTVVILEITQKMC